MDPIAGWGGGGGSAYASFAPLLVIGLFLCCFQTSSPLLCSGDIFKTAQAPLATEGRPSGKQRKANQLITSPLCPQQQTVDFYSTWKWCRLMKRPERRGRWELQLWNSKWWSRAKWPCGERQTSLKPALRSSWENKFASPRFNYLNYH